MSVNTYAFRLKPGTDLRIGIERFIVENAIQAGWIITCVGSLVQYDLRFANQSHGAKQKGNYEILSLAGTLSRNGCHLHISLADHTGSTIGGHLLEGCIIYTTAEVIIGTTKEFIFERETDGETGWKELLVKTNQDENSCI